MPALPGRRLTEARLFASGGRKWKKESFQPEKGGVGNFPGRITKYWDRLLREAVSSLSCGGTSSPGHVKP